MIIGIADVDNLEKLSVTEVQSLVVFRVPGAAPLRQILVSRAIVAGTLV